MRMDENALEERLAELHDKRRPVLAVIGILGTTEFGSIDPVHEIIAARQRWRRQGLEFAVHIDAAWGGYLASMFRAADGSLLERDDMTRHFERFPTPRVYQRSEEHTSELQSRGHLVCRRLLEIKRIALVEAY